MTASVLVLEVMHRRDNDPFETLKSKKAKFKYQQFPQSAQMSDRTLLLN